MEIDEKDLICDLADDVVDYSKKFNIDLPSAAVIVVEGYGFNPSHLSFYEKKEEVLQELRIRASLVKQRKHRQRKRALGVDKQLPLL